MPKSTSSWRAFFGSPLFLVIGVILLLLISLNIVRAYYQQHQIREEVQHLEQETANLQSKKSELLKALQYTQSDAYVEEKARTELNMVKQGEKVAIFPPSVPLTVSRQPEKTVVESPQLTNPQKWWDYFFGSN